MGEYMAKASIYIDLLTPGVVKRSQSDDPTCCTPIHRITCNSIEDLYDLFLDRYGTECDRLRGYVYLYAQVNGTWQRISD